MEITATEHVRAMRGTLANILRVMRGGGRQRQIIVDIERIAAATSSHTDAHQRTLAADALAHAANSWDSAYIDRLQGIFDREGSDIVYAKVRLEHGICKAALRIMASELDGNGIEASKAYRDLWEDIFTYNRALAEDRERQEREEIEALMRTRDAAAAAERRAERHNAKVIAAANDNADCYVYFVTDGEAIKIGKAINPKSRLGGLQTSHHKPLRILALIPGDETLEKRLHGKFSKYSIRGEWFMDCREIRDFIRKFAANDNKPATANAA